jgi:uncharacterized repeat protein (TIGR01451 family)
MVGESTQRNEMGVLMRSILTVLGVLAAAAFPAGAHAAATVKVTVPSATVHVGAAQSYSYEITFDSAPDRYTVQVFRAEGDVDPISGEPTGRTPMEAERSTSLADQASPVSGGGTYTASQPGDYIVRVSYYAKGKAQAEQVAEAAWTVQAPPSAPQPAQRAVPAPVAATPTPVPPTGTSERARLRLVKRAAKRVVRAGGSVTFRLAVRSVGPDAARNVEVCDRLPRQVQYLSASRRVEFRRGRACFVLGNLKPGAKRTITLRLRVDVNTRIKRIVNRATATADNANTVRAHATVKVKPSQRVRRAPVTG